MSDRIELPRTNVSIHRAGRIVLAIGDNDPDQAVEILREATGDALGVMAVVVELATLALDGARAVAGDRWRESITTSLYRLELADIADQVTNDNTKED